MSRSVTETLISPPHRSRRLWATVLTTATSLLLGAALVVPAQAVPPDDPADAGRPVVLPRLVARATMPADELAPRPRSDASDDDAGSDARTSSSDGQIIPGFSAAVANGDGTFWAMPDNDVDTEASSGDILLRIHLIRPRWERADGGTGSVQILRHLTLADPYRQIPFPIVRDNTRGRHLTDGDLDIESLQRMPDGSFWIGDERGPFLVHVDRHGRVLNPPMPFPDGGSPQNPDLDGEPAATQTSGGIEAMAMSRNGRYLYPILEKALATEEDGRRRIISQFDTRRQRYTGRTWDYRTDTDTNLVADAQLVGSRALLVLERDDFDGEAAVSKRVYRIDLDRNDRSGMLAKKLVVDLLKLDNPSELGKGDGWGTGDPFSFGLRSVETLVPLPNGNLLLANDNDYPGSAARRPGTPDDPELIIIDPEATVTAHEAEGTVIAHRGASGYRPEHTLAAYALAIRQCADVIEPDIVLTKDNVPVARHENEIGGTTDVATKFPKRIATTKDIDGDSVRGWFTEDFTLAELRTLRTKERIPGVRPTNKAFDGKYPIPTLAEVLDLARHSRTCSGRPVGVTPETKHPTYFDSIGQRMDEPLLDALAAANLNRRRSPVVIQSFEVGNLRRLNQQTPVGISQLVNCGNGKPYDFEVAKDPRTYATMATAAGLAEIAEYADAVGFCKNVMIPRDDSDALDEPSSAIRDAHAAGLTVIGWTFRRENRYLPADFRDGSLPYDPNAPGDLQGEIRTFLLAGMDGYFTDNPDIGSELDIDVT